MQDPMVPIRPGDGAEFLIYPAEDGQTRIAVQVAEETVWLSQRQLAELFQKDVRTINEHIQNLYAEGELERAPTIRKYQIVQTEGVRTVQREVEFYNLDVIISVGYRVRSQRGTQFRRWATQRLREYILKGFVLDEARLTRDAFDALVERVRAIRASEQHFGQKITDLYATSIDYDPDHPQARAFLATVQSKLHAAVRGRPAAAPIAVRADASPPPVGLASERVSEGSIRQMDAGVARSELTAEEVSHLGLLVEQYLSFAELQARRGKEMRMADWEAKLDAFLRLNGCPVLEAAGRGD
jgi:hypothetical protein